MRPATSRRRASGSPMPTCRTAPRRRPPEAAATEGEKEADASAGAGRVEVVDYTQEKSGDALIVRGTLRNPGATPAMNVRMSVTAIDAKGQTITSGEAGLSNGTIEPFRTVAFSVTIPVGTRAAGSLGSRRAGSLRRCRLRPRLQDGDAGARDRAAGAAALAAAPARPRSRRRARRRRRRRRRTVGEASTPLPSQCPLRGSADGKTGYSRCVESVESAKRRISRETVERLPFSASVSTLSQQCPHPDRRRQGLSARDARGDAARRETFGPRRRNRLAGRRDAPFG